MREYISAASTPRGDNEKSNGMLQEVSPVERKRGRPKKSKHSFEATISPRNRGMHYQYAPFSPLNEPASLSNFWETTPRALSRETEKSIEKIE